MATIGVLVPASPGHLNPMGSLGRELASRGHRVVVAVLPEIEPTIRAAGLDFAPIGAKDFPMGTLDEVHAHLGELKGFAALKYTIEMMGQFARTIMNDSPDAFRSVGADLLLVDQAAPGGGAVADHLGLPYVNVANALMFNADPMIPPMSTSLGYSKTTWAKVRNHLSYTVLRRILRPIINTVADQRAAWGLPSLPNPNDWYSPFAQVGQQPVEFEFPRGGKPANFHYAGPFQDPRARAPVSFPFDRLDGRPMIYASMGTLQNRLQWIFQTIAEACDGQGVQLVISLGGSAEPESLGELPGSPMVVRAAPQLEVLKSATMVITHAGMNTALECLARGVPMVAIPITNDQPGVAARVAWSGAGLIVPPSKLTTKRLRGAIRRVLDEPSFAHHAMRMRDAIARTGGVRHAADVVERVLETGKPVLAEEFRWSGASTVNAV